MYLSPINPGDFQFMEKIKKIHAFIFRCGIHATAVYFLYFCMYNTIAWYIEVPLVIVFWNVSVVLHEVGHWVIGFLYGAPGIIKIVPAPYHREMPDCNIPCKYIIMKVLYFWGFVFQNGYIEPNLCKKPTRTEHTVKKLAGPIATLLFVVIGICIGHEISILFGFMNLLLFFIAMIPVSHTDGAILYMTSEEWSDMEIVFDFVQYMVSRDPDFIQKMKKNAERQSSRCIE